MKILIQRVEFAKLFIDKDLFSEIKDGFLVFVGIEKGDEYKIDKAIEKILKIKIIEDNKGKFKYSLFEIKKPLMVISQITLIPEFEENKPEFLKSPEKNIAEKIYLEFLEKIKENGLEIKYGEFGKFMEIENKNIGPISFILKI